VDGAVSKTINIPETFPFEEFRKVYDLAYARGLKGCTTFRPNPVTGAVLEAGEGTLAPHCCHPQREAD
jgi:ribonucleoside-diphosphate reductase alpha chain